MSLENKVKWRKLANKGNKGNRKKPLNSGEKSVQRNLNDSLPRTLGHAATGHSKPHNYWAYNIIFIFLLYPTHCLKLLELYLSPIQWAQTSISRPFCIISLSGLTTDRYTELGCQGLKPKSSDPPPPPKKSGKTQTPPPQKKINLENSDPPPPRKKPWKTQPPPPKKNLGKLSPPPPRKNKKNVT